MALSGNQITRLGACGVSRGKYAPFAAKAEAEDESINIVGGPRRRSWRLYSKFYARCKKHLEDEKIKPVIPEVIEPATEINIDRQPEVRNEIATYEKSVDQLDALIAKVSDKIEQTKVVFRDQRAKPESKEAKTTKSKIHDLKEKKEVFIEARSQTEAYIEDLQDEDDMIIFAAQIILQQEL